jgi:hypothetical protein
MAAGASGRVHDRVGLLLSSTEQRRCRLQGLQDASLHFGWVTSFDDGVIHVEVNSKRPINQGDFLYLEVSAANALLTFVAYVTSAAGATISLQVSSEVEERKLKSESRIRVRSFEGYVACSSGSHKQISVVDVSENGFGFVSQEQIDVTGPCGITLTSAYGDINLQGDVRHAHNDKDLSAYRGGVLIQDMDRVSRARWVRLIGG